LNFALDNFKPIKLSGNKFKPFDRVVFLQRKKSKKDQFDLTLAIRINLPPNSTNDYLIIIELALLCLAKYLIFNTLCNARVY
jgi:hypothetical protein